MFPLLQNLPPVPHTDEYVVKMFEDDRLSIPSKAFDLSSSTKEASLPGAFFHPSSCPLRLLYVGDDADRVTPHLPIVIPPVENKKHEIAETKTIVGSYWSEQENEIAVFPFHRPPWRLVIVFHPDQKNSPICFCENEKRQ